VIARWSFRFRTFFPATAALTLLRFFFFSFLEKKMTSNPARLRWLIRLDDDEGEETEGPGSPSSIDEDLLWALRSIPSWPAEEEKKNSLSSSSASVNAAAASAPGSGDHFSALSRLLLHPAPRRPLDRRRALASCLAQHVAVCAGLGVEWERSPGISRTVKGGKPFVRRREKGGESGEKDENGDDEKVAPNFNFNVSHDGPWLALAAEPLLLVGVDVTSPRVIGGGGAAGNGNANGNSSGSKPSQPPPPLGVARLQRSLGSALADSEWARVALEPDASSQDALFRRFWALREAWSKARGDGLGAADLARAEFSLGGGEDGECDDEEVEVEEEEDLTSSSSPPPPRITLRLDGKPQRQWSFELQDLPDGSALAVALGPPSAAVDAGGTFLETLRRASLSEAEVAEAQRESISSAKAVAAALNGSCWHKLSVRALIEEAEMRKRGKRETGEEEETL